MMNLSHYLRVVVHTQFIYDSAIPDDVYILADIPVGAIDEDQGVIDKAYNLLAPAKFQDGYAFNNVGISGNSEFGNQISIEQAEASVRDSLGLNEGVSLLDNDFIENEDSDYKQWLKHTEALAVTKDVLEVDPLAS